jgi:hypothetical protein
MGLAFVKTTLPYRCPAVRSIGFALKSKKIMEWRGRESNSQPRAYESPALPLSYLAGLKDTGIIFQARSGINMCADAQT